MASTQDIYTELKKELHTSGSKAQVILPSDGDVYEQSIKRWSDHCVKRAACVVKPTIPSDITAVLSHVRIHAIPFVVKGGGHSTSGSASITDGLVIDLDLMRKVEIDVEGKTIRAEGGCRWVDVDVEAAKYGLVTVGGTVNDTGVGGLTLGGGYGFLTGEYGLAIDNLLSIDIVLASGTQITASATSNADLFWALRGAGQNFGVTTAFTFRAHPQPNPVFAGQLVFTPDKLPNVVAFANHFHTATNGKQALLWGFTCPPPANTPIVMAVVFHNGSRSEGETFFQPLIDVGPVVNTTGMMPYAQLNGIMNETALLSGRKMFGGGAFKLPLDASFVSGIFDDFAKFSTSREGVGESMMLWETIPYGEVVKVGNGQMAFANRGEYYNLATLFKWYDPALDDEIREFSRGLLRRASKSAGLVRDQESRGGEGVGVYGNYSNTDVPATEIYGENAKKLQKLKNKYDPDNLFDRGTRLVPRPLVVVN